MSLLNLPPEIRDKALAKLGLTLEQYQAQEAKKEADRKVLREALAKSTGAGPPEDEPERFHDEIGFDVLDDE